MTAKLSRSEGSGPPVVAAAWRTFDALASVLVAYGALEPGTLRARPLGVAAVRVCVCGGGAFVV